MRGETFQKRDRCPPSSRLAVGLGTNLGHRARNLELGRAALIRLLDELRCSSIYETEPRGVRAQPRFLNACCTGRSRLAPGEALGRLQEIEREAGRRPRGPRGGPRVLDLDLLLYDGRVIDRPGLRVPHPRMQERAFVLIPLAEVAPEWMHPETGLTVRELAAAVSAEGVEPWGGWRETADG